MSRTPPRRFERGLSNLHVQYCCKDVVQEIKLDLIDWIIWPWEAKNRFLCSYLTVFEISAKIYRGPYLQILHEDSLYLGSKLCNIYFKIPTIKSVLWLKNRLNIALFYTVEILSLRYQFFKPTRKRQHRRLLADRWWRSIMALTLSIALWVLHCG